MNPESSNFSRQRFSRQRFERVGICPPKSTSLPPIAELLIRQLDLTEKMMSKPHPSLHGFSGIMTTAKLTSKVGETLSGGTSSVNYPTLTYLRYSKGFPIHGRSPPRLHNQEWSYIARQLLNLGKPQDRTASSKGRSPGSQDPYFF
jgi:hypothetical protein